MAILALTIIIRIMAQGDPRLSIANDDTASYISSSEAPLSSREAFSGRRLFTTNLVYQVLKPDQGYKIIVNGSIDTTKRRVQPSFVKIVLLQFIVSIASWSVLTLSITNRIKNPLTKILTAMMISTFAFVPQIADWDSILTSESLSFSLLALQTGLLIELAFRFAKETRPTLSTSLLTALWLAVVFFWTFLKDAHLYEILILLIMITGIMATGKFRKSGGVFIILAILSGFFLLGWMSSGNSERTKIQMMNVYKSDLLPDPARVKLMQSNGMPDPKSPAFDDWFPANAKTAYIKFLVFHPGYILTNYLQDTPYAFSENTQAYFNTRPPSSLRKSLMSTGNLLHLENPIPMLASCLLLLGILFMAYKDRSTESIVWSWLAGWMFLSACVNMFVNIFGDVLALPRHALVATTLFRLFMWIIPLVLADRFISSPRRQLQAKEA
ncbi:MAG: hypothetical protein K8S20_13925 [Chloroflexi bacterium]|nr:hypothetical protein [Chloroflexota bacterium]